MFVYELWVRVVGHEMPWSRVACNSTSDGNDFGLDVVTSDLLHLSVVLVSNNNMYIDIKPDFYFCID